MKIKELLANESNWCQKLLARTACGEVTGCENADAASWCVMGALYRCYPHVPMHRVVVQKLVMLVAPRYIGSSISDMNNAVVDWNDDPNRTFAEVQKVLKLADV